MSPTQVVLPVDMKLYRHVLQENGAGIRGIDLKAHLQALGRLTRCVRLEDEEVDGWVLKPASYPEELRGKKVVLLVSNPLGSDGFATSLEWQDNRVQEVPVWLQDIFGGDSYVLLRTK